MRAAEVVFRERTLHVPLQCEYKASHSGFETQRIHHQKSKIGVPVAPK